MKEKITVYIEGTEDLIPDAASSGSAGFDLRSGSLW